MISKLTPDELEVLRSLRDGNSVPLSPMQHLRLSKRSLIRGSADRPILTVVGRDRANESDAPTKGRLA